jgi:trimethylamine--corrinoid protein Co-methyltransferase
MAIPCYNLLADCEIEAIHEATLTVLAEIGVEFTHPAAHEVFRQHGAAVKGDRVFLPRELVESSLKKAPSQFTLHARNPEHNVVIGGPMPVYAPGYGAPFVADFDHGRRPSTLKDYENLVRLAGASPALDISGGTVVEPTDVPDSIRHLEMLYASIKNSGKVFMGSASGAARALDSIEMAGILFGGKGRLREKPALLSLINSITPLKFDDRMLGAMVEYAKHNQAMIIASLAMAGATSPVTLAGTLVVQNAEVLAGIVLTQLINPGTPVVYGSASSIADMRYASLAIGAPEETLLIAATAQLARFYGVPSRAGGALSDAKTPDAQAGYESMMVLYAAGISGISFTLHAAGIQEYYMTLSYEKFIIDVEICGMVKRILRGFNVKGETLALDVLQKVGPGGHFLDQDHTYNHYASELRVPFLSDRGTFEAWTKNGEQTAAERANATWKKVLEEYEPPALERSLDQELKQYARSQK